ncbi:Surp module [Novymonas esmeraldas]|uniref:Surp module n=1 Tax=Novymonas esmeraldas TaxID=1808958 RepID=A0AAW0F3U8_9TRYP
MENEEALPTIVVPGPELREKVDAFAARLSALDRRKADEMVAKLLASSKRNQFLFVDTSHIFYPYFLSKLTEFRQHPELRPQKVGEAKDGNVERSAATTTKAGTITRTVGGTAGAEDDPRREELLRQTEVEARRYLDDPFPNHYSLERKAGTVDVTALLMDVLSTTAQYTAKYGDTFLAAVLGKQRHNPLFHFLHEEDVRHGLFRKLVESYRRILTFDEEETETRLENIGSPAYLLGTVCEEKKKYAKAALARRRAALLTDEELRGRLQWTLFSVAKTFRLSDLQLDGPVPETAASQKRAAPVVSSNFISPALTSNTTPRPPASEAPVSAAAVAPAPAPGGPTAAAASHPPGGAAPSFAPVFMSTTLVKGTGSNGKRPRERGG